MVSGSVSYARQFGAWLQGLPRPTSSVPGLTLAAAVFIAVFLNTVFWKTVIAFSHDCDRTA